MTDEPKQTAAERPAPDTDLPTLVFKGVSYPGETPDTIEYSGALFDEQGRVLAKHAHAVLPLLPSLDLSPKRRGRPPKDLRAALALVAAFAVAEFRQLADRGSSKKSMSRHGLGYADDRSARAALKAARQKIKKNLPEMRWSGVYQPRNPFDAGRLAPPELKLAARGLGAVWMTGDGAMPRLGEPWTGRAIAVFLPVDFKPRKEAALVLCVERIKF